MKSRYKCILCLLLAVLLLTGCMKTVDQMYRLPKRSDEFTELQSAIDDAMSDLNYCAPLSGENQQAVQMADLDGDGLDEYLVFAICDSETPLRVLIFKQLEDSYVLAQTLNSNGTAFDVVEYAQMDGQPGLEIVFGSQLAEQISRNVEVYSFSADLKADLLLSARYTELMVVNLDQDQTGELFVMKPGEKETDNGIVELYDMVSGAMVRSNELNLSGPAQQLKRVIAGNIHGGIPAVYAATTVDDTALITDVYTYQSGKLCNVTYSHESGSSVRTMRNYYVYADDIDNDGVLELPYLLPMMPMDNVVSSGKQELIRWYAVTEAGDEVIKAFTFHNFVDGWYVELSSNWAPMLSVVGSANTYEFYIWNEDFELAEKVLTIVETIGHDDVTKDAPDDLIVLHDGSGILITAQLEDCASNYAITQNSLRESFHMIRQDWKTGET